MKLHRPLALIGGVVILLLAVCIFFGTRWYIKFPVPWDEPFQSIPPSFDFDKLFLGVFCGLLTVAGAFLVFHCFQKPGTTVPLPRKLPPNPLVRPPQPGVCANCEYDLTGNVSGACPECGTPINDGDNGSTPAYPIERDVEFRNHSFLRDLTRTILLLPVMYLIYVTLRSGTWPQALIWIGCMVGGIALWAWDDRRRLRNYHCPRCGQHLHEPVIREPGTERAVTFICEPCGVEWDTGMVEGGDGGGD